MKISGSENVILLKGNHEDYSASGMPYFYPCDLINEVKTKWGDWNDYFNSRLRPFFDNLYLAAIVQGFILFVHGGISSKINSLNDLNAPGREVEIDVLWSDPYRIEGEYLNPRGAGVLFGPDITKTICERLNVKKIVRSHEPRKAIGGPYEEHGGKVVTISSTKVYGGKPFVLVFDGKNLEKYQIVYL
jgi:diadenosine tetraphosphatase ApaH/serine/threonine PP2A family protein phosphatase